MDNVIPQTIDFRQKTDLIINLYRLYHVDHNLDYRYVADILMSSLIDNDIQRFENKLYENIIKNNLNRLGVTNGISRLILIDLFSDKFLKGENVELLNL
jgi:hypothetical protein